MPMRWTVTGALCSTAALQAIKAVPLAVVCLIRVESVGVCASLVKLSLPAPQLSFPSLVTCSFCNSLRAFRIPSLDSSTSLSTLASHPGKSSQPPSNLLSTHLTLLQDVWIR